MAEMTPAEMLLLISSIALLPIALAYGLYPKFTMRKLYNIEVRSTNLANITRSIMGLHLAFIIYWMLAFWGFIGAKAALGSLTTFMFGLAFGRTVSWCVDGKANLWLVLYLILEVFLGCTGLFLVLTM
ncbi:DUF4345 domain-containing protein [Halodesulfovibrio aestuarii]|uniref:DUF4345 domain-containing protein n=1 Tax=Halodesulfovibrio aestuarii TaxID=126333 RepID=A0A8G2C9Z9_9BACT|nr:DUF4345 domain-containing protein [Halodesulfovibrio aestuarii]SHJ24064.1 protein of unknown function [Halodesulfovibrio aestuarii]